jgi:integrase
VVKPSGRLLHTPRKWFGRCRELAKIETTEKGRVTWHSLRHTFAERLRKAGARIEDIEALMNYEQGHHMTRHYADHDKVRNLDRLPELAKVVALFETVNKTDNMAVTAIRTADGG